MYNFYHIIQRLVPNKSTKVMNGVASGTGKMEEEGECGRLLIFIKALLNYLNMYNFD